MKISKIEYKNYIEWQAQRYKYMEYIETPHKYKGGEIYISGAPTKRAIQVKVCYKNIGYCKIFDVPCDVLEYEEKTGSFLCRKIETRKMYTWRDAETYNLALEFGRGILDCLEMLEKYCFSCKPIDCKFVEDETTIRRDTAKEILNELGRTPHEFNEKKIKELAERFGVEV